MNMEQKMVEKFMSRLRQQKPTQEMPQLTWRMKEEPDDEQFEILLQSDCHKQNVITETHIRKKKKNSWV